jgi:hypothetical protein
MRSARHLGWAVLVAVCAGCGASDDDGSSSSPATAAAAEQQGNTSAVDPVPGDTDPGDTDPGDTDPGDTDAGDTDADPVDADLPIPLVVSRRAVLATDFESSLADLTERPEDGLCQTVASDSIGIEDPERPGVFVPDYRDATPDTALATWITGGFDGPLPTRGWHRLDRLDGTTTYVFVARDGVRLAEIDVQTALGRFGVVTATSCDGLDATTEPDVDGSRFAPLSVDAAVGPYHEEEAAAQAGNEALLDALVAAGEPYSDVTVAEVGSAGGIRDTTIRTWSYDAATDRCALAVDLVAQARATGLTGMTLSTPDPAGGTIWAGTLTDGDHTVTVVVRTTGDDVTVRVGPDHGSAAPDGADMPCAL